MKIKMVFSIITVVSVALSLSPGIAFAAESGQSTGSFQCGNIAPTVGTITTSFTTTMTPGVEYTITVPVTDANTLNDLDTVKVYIYYDADGTYNTSDRPVSGDTQKCAILTWTNSSTWSIDPTGGGTTWALVNGNSSPSLSLSSGDFVFAFKPGLVAQETPSAPEWHIYAVADDGLATGNNSKEDMEMAWYGQITVTTTNVNWGSVNPGLNFGGTNSKNGSISMTYKTNGNYYENISASSSWDGTPSGTATLNVAGTPGANEFSLEADDADIIGNAVLVTASPTYATMDNTGTFTDELGNTVATNSIWLKLGTPFTSATYNGTIYFQIGQRS